MSCSVEKSALRSKAAKTRKAAKAANPQAGQTLAFRIEDFLKERRISSGRIVSIFIPIGSEIETSVAAAMLARDFDLCLPVVVAEHEPLIFRAWQPGDPLVEGAFGIPVPLPSQPQIEPDVLLVPLLAFDERGYRLGYGGGYYDRTLTQLKRSGAPLAVGLAFDEQQVPQVPIEATAIALDAVITPTRTIAAVSP